MKFRLSLAYDPERDLIVREFERSYTTSAARFDLTMTAAFSWPRKGTSDEHVS